jgi:uncharacterized iron-regulated membrane protein
MRKWWFLIHKWVGLIVGLQILAWMASGLFMTWFPIEQVRNEHLIREAPLRALQQSVDLTTASDALATLSIPISRLELVDIAGRWMWRIDSNGKPHALIDIATGRVVSPLGEAAAREIAAADYAGGGKIVSAALIEKEAPIEYRSTLPVWQFVYDDADETHLYVAPLTGKVVARRSGLWRVYDFLWSLHIMDYTTRDDFNNWPVVIMSLLGLALTITGIGLLVYRFWPSLKFSTNRSPE